MANNNNVKKISFWELNQDRDSAFMGVTGAGSAFRSCAFGSGLDLDPKSDHTVHLSRTN